MSKAVLLDWDGVLCDSLLLYIDLYKEACRRNSKVMPVEGVDAFKAWYNPRWEHNYYEMGFSETQFREVLAFSESYLNYSRCSLFPGVADMLASLAADYPLAIVSTTPSGLIRARLGGQGLDVHFKVVTGGEDGDSGKVEKIGATLRKLGCKQGVMVGDTPLDVESGKANGLSTVGVTYGWVTPVRMQQAQPDRLVTGPEGLEAAIRDLLR